MWNISALLSTDVDGRPVSGGPDRVSGVDYEHQPNPGPGLWVGAGLLLLVAGLSLLYVQVSGDGDSVLAVAGGVLALVGLGVFAAGGWQLVRGRRRRRSGAAG
jgi:hypothetical protein